GLSAGDCRRRESSRERVDASREWREMIRGTVPLPAAGNGPAGRFILVSTPVARAAALVLLAFVWAAPLRAVVITVNTTDDLSPADDGTCSLREAVTAANDDTGSGVTPGECAAGA